MTASFCDNGCLCTLYTVHMRMTHDNFVTRILFILFLVISFSFFFLIFNFFFRFVSLSLFFGYWFGFLNENEVCFTFVWLSIIGIVTILKLRSIFHAWNLIFNFGHTFENIPLSSSLDLTNNRFTSASKNWSRIRWNAMTHAILNGFFGFWILCMEMSNRYHDSAPFMRWAIQNFIYWGIILSELSV